MRLDLKAEAAYAACGAKACGVALPGQGMVPMSRTMSRNASMCCDLFKKGRKVPLIFSAFKARQFPCQRTALGTWALGQALGEVLPHLERNAGDHAAPMAALGHEAFRGAECVNVCHGATWRLLPELVSFRRGLGSPKTSLRCAAACNMFPVILFFSLRSLCVCGCLR